MSLFVVITRQKLEDQQIELILLAFKFTLQSKSSEISSILSVKIFVNSYMETYNVLLILYLILSTSYINIQLSLLNV